MLNYWIDYKKAIFLNNAQFCKQAYHSILFLIYSLSNNLFLYSRSGLGSLRRGMGKTSGSELIGIPRKTKAAMIWKKGWKSWKKLQSLGNNSNNSKIIGESNRFGL